ncbi:RodZ domain-containing protein [Neptuniibacter caesariensis]|uniref:Cytoskeleton protein RodZ-like C-terminal domain-containing protein n=1 Tax=Neptuniibacter caesariensis TaxID=207954 RepID=A0A7U8C1D6_NEPCE|nr:RodZ family helix-turn-helix domain-containing protein [Neptuniibacter caesariensis]EAR59663.1 hypothetical protein MED92_00590 [Oceanospirillum sp. MED92] [Neptuniibacter caesariensis]
MSTEEQECQPELLAEEWGARLTTARESLSLSIEQVSADLNLPQDYIRKLEIGSLEGLPSLVFARGYIRAYAKLLHLDDNQLVSEFEQLHGESSGGAIKPVSRVREQVKVNDPVMKLSSWIFVLAIIGVTVWWWQTQYGGSFSFSSSSETEQMTEQPLVAEDNADTADVVELEDGTAKLVLPVLEDSPAGEEAQEEPASTEAETSEVAEESEPQYLTQAEINKLQQAIDDNAPATHAASEPAVQAAPAIEASVAQSSEALTAKISADFVAECWVSIKDADGKTLFNNLRGKGQSLEVSGKAPVSILLGAADAVGRFTFNGTELDLDKHSRKNVVRISLPISE